MALASATMLPTSSDQTEFNSLKNIACFARLTLHSHCFSKLRDGQADISAAMLS